MFRFFLQKVKIYRIRLSGGRSELAPGLPLLPRDRSRRTGSVDVDLEPIQKIFYKCKFKSIHLMLAIWNLTC
jgi:hypothetical protein